MSKSGSMLGETLEAWSDVRAGLIEEVENVPADRFDFRPAEEVRSVAELIRHIVEVERMMAGELTRQDGDFTRAPFPQLIEEYAGHVAEIDGKEGLVALLDDSFRESEAKFREVGELFMLQYIRRFDGKPGTRLAWLHHGIEQEMYHRGQITLYERLLGIVPALTRRIRGG